MTTHYGVGPDQVACGRNDHNLVSVRTAAGVTCKNCRSTVVYRSALAAAELNCVHAKPVSEVITPSAKPIAFQDWLCKSRKGDRLPRGRYFAGKEAGRIHGAVLPSVYDWCLYSGVAESKVVAELNCALGSILLKAERERLEPWDLVGLLSIRIDAVQQRYGDYGAYDSEPRDTMAEFFEDNYRPDTYRYVRWWVTEQFPDVPF